MEEKVKVGDRIDVFRVESNIYGNFWKQNGWYAESTLSDRYNNNAFIGHKRYGRDMICDPNGINNFIPHQNIINQHVKNGMIKVGTLIITKLK